MSKKTSIYSIAILIIMLCLMACGGGSGDNSGTTTPTTSNNGSVALYMSDGPTDDYDNLWIWVSEVSMLSSDSSEPVIIFESDDAEGDKLDLLDMKNEDVLFSVNDEVPSGTYSKIRLKITDIQPEGGSGACTDLEVKLPSGKIDLKPKSDFSVVAGETLPIRLDIDADKSINLHPAGKSGKCIFRPVVFLDIQPDNMMKQCPKLIKGVIDEVTYNTDNTVVEGFILSLGQNRGKLTVMISDTTSLYDETGTLTTSINFAKDQTVFVKGMLNDKGALESTFIILGDIETYKGIVKSATTDLLTITPNGSTDDILANLSSETTIFSGCNEIFDGSIIPTNAMVEVVGKYASEEDTSSPFKALIVYIKEHAVGDLLLTAVAPVTDGYNLTIQNNDNPATAYFLPTDAKVKLEGRAGDIDITDLIKWVACQSRSVKIKLDDSDTLNQKIEELTVMADTLASQVTSIDESTKILTTAEGKIRVQDTVKILKTEDGHQTQANFSDIKENDNVKFFGITACNDDIDGIYFYAYVIIIMSFDDDAIAALSETINKNNTVVNLSLMDYEQDLTINGNKVTLNGFKGASCDSTDDWTTINGKVIINGNKVVLKGIKFLGTVEQKGNNIQLIDCCFP